MEETSVDYFNPSNLLNVTWLSLGCFGLLLVLGLAGFVAYMIVKSRR